MTGAWAATTELGRRVQARYAALRRVRGPFRVGVHHVRAHARQPGNEAADALAKEGAAGSEHFCDSEETLTYARDVYARYCGEGGTPANGADSQGPSDSTSDSSPRAQPYNFSPGSADSVGVG